MMLNLKSVVMRGRYEDYLKGKSICLVGPAPTIDRGDKLENKKQADFIESHDVVVRLNKALPIPDSYKSFLGKRTDVLYNCMLPTPTNGGYLDIEFLKKEIDWLVSSVPDISPFSSNISNFRYRNANSLNFSVSNVELFLHAQSEMRTRPNTGVMAILDMLSCDIKSLYIMGMTFFKGGHLQKYRNHTPREVSILEVEYGAHRQEPQRKYIKNILSSDTRVEADSFFMEALDE